MKILVNASNLHAGGGVAVASSMVHEFGSMSDPDVSFTVVVSTEVARNLDALGTHTAAFADYQVFDVAGLQALWTRHPFKARDFDAVLNVFGPSYHLPWALGSVMGFAQPWVAFPRNDAYRLLSAGDRVKTRLHFAGVAAWFLLADTLVVEQEAIRKALRRRRLFRGKRIEVVSSTVDSVYGDQTRWAHLDLPARRAPFRMGVIARNYPHKNLEILPEVKRRLASDHEIEVEFLVTLPEHEWLNTSPTFQSEVVNVGPLSLAQCPTFNSQLDAVVFPTLLESFSATPIEAEAAGIPLFASDLEVIRDTVGDYATYFDPLDAGSIARAIASEIAAGGGKLRRRNGRTWAGNQDAAHRAREIVAVCREFATRRSKAGHMVGEAMT